MADLISRQTAIETLKEHRELYCDNTPYAFSKLSYAEKSRVDELDTAIAMLVDLPSAQSEMKHGKWIDSNGLYQCSVCNHIWSELWWTSVCPIDRMNKMMHYCPSCGARMDEEVDYGKIH